MKRYILPIFILPIFFLASCEDIIDVKLNNKDLDLYAIEAKITTQSNPYVYLYKSLRVNEETSYPGVSGATVIISDDSQPQKSLQLEESNETKGLYLVPESTNFIGETGKEYTISIEHDGVTISASDVLSEVEPIDSIQIRPSLRGDERFLGIFTYGNEPSGIGDFYKWDIYINGELLNEAEYLMVASDELVDGNFVSSFEIFTDFHDPDEPEEKLLKLGYQVQVKQTSISEFVYKYFDQMVDQNYTGGMFSVPPANIKSNFTASNGKTVLGLFSAHDISNSNMITISQELVDQLKD